jgi:hypothetical protein
MTLRSKRSPYISIRSAVENNNSVPGLRYRDGDAGNRPESAGPAFAHCACRRGGANTADSWRRFQRAGKPAAALCGTPQGLSAACVGHLSPREMDRAVRHARRLLSVALRALGSRTECTWSGGANRFPQPALLFLLHRDLAAGILLSDRPAHPGGDGAVPDERHRRPAVVRLPLPADGLDRFVPSHRTLGRRRPARASATRSSALDDRAHCTRRRQAFPLADDRLVDRRRLGPVLRRRADAGQRPRDVSGAARRLCVHRPPDLHDLCARRMDARAGLRLHVPVATHSGGAHRRIRAQRHLSLRPRRTASIGEESSDLARARLAGRRLHRIVCNACMFARPASTSAADPMSAAFNAACASMLAMP